ncbi:tRNA1(Val) A37 N6-methylase TrmN6 [Devosia enhydra]|uniref:tRNA1(Val) A37 N6-methylase TrmN6 n=1 Tax=Devosia enhydra TaxID=665118 RepID=A0A1K2I1F2_9HYPH|nr:methyltransferase [Devosia enhydra]SFZ86087.1 tRNA1(Val) A37 N6-methylase TrmN6 [Devosia enhydra]
MSLDHPGADVKPHSITRDAFLGGRLNLSQPRHGFRAGLDSVLLGTSLSENRQDFIDIGAGVGTAALVALAHGARHATLVEIDPATAELARANVAANGFAERAEVVTLDILAAGAARIAAGLAPDRYDAVIANPPFFAEAEGTLAPANSRRIARHMPAEALDLWVKAAAGLAGPGAEILFILPAERLGPLLAGFEKRFGAITILPLSPRLGEKASRILLRGIKGSRAPLTLLPSRALHGPDGGFAPEFEAIFRGQDRLHW